MHVMLLRMGTVLPTTDMCMELLDTEILDTELLNMCMELLDMELLDKCRDRSGAVPVHDGTPLSELSWSSSLAVVAVSFSGLFTFIFLMLACLCCKKGDIGFKVRAARALPAGSSRVPSGCRGAGTFPAVPVTLERTRVPGPQVFLGEVNSGISSTQVVVKELKASASVQELLQFLEEHTNLLQCLAQCAEVTPYLLVMEFCPLGWGKRLRAQRGLRRRRRWEGAGRRKGGHSLLVLTLHTWQDDYFVTADQLWVPLRWIAPELIDEVHGNPLIVDQTKSSNVWSLGVTIWELFELGNQPYDHYSDRQVLAYAIKEQQLKLPKPQLKLTLSERWYEVMQFCWLQPEQRPTAEENNESPEFVLKEPHEPREPEGFVPPAPGGQGDGPDAETRLPAVPGTKSPCRDSAYFSDCDAEAERGPEDSDGGPGTGQAPGEVEEPPAPPPGPPWRMAGGNVEPALGLSPSPTEDACPSKTFFPSPAATSIEDEVAQGPAVSHGVCGLGGSQEGAEQTVCPGPGSGHREEPEEEEEDTEDSDESDEELRCYNVQEQSEESEEEPAAVPIVVAESHSARNLRSLLKMPSLLSASFCEDLERKKKAVSFFDDVTIYLFDQESPTRELGEQSFPDGPGQPPAGGGPDSPAERLSAPNASSDGSASEESGGFEWDDDFPLMPGKASLMSSLAGTPAEPVPAVPSLRRGVRLQFSRFTVSPAPVSRFSITHVSDSDMDSVGGSREDGCRE
ncbi:PREDICTED: serine/threonine-protein kinase LMTK1 [Tinamus guttatus]|uniref:serine/threonine-protein kinase LMTK1 n=1 Tax=Tinamus guttatus TaxID=94827 RepID=UPI00052E9A53|nr:PREDICTED: serine/threonine-protein kinase LMTK1 [Tinamus guttatus]